ncbi:MAG: Thioredoxin reductase [Parcubacteria group bacterium GW2011_GWA2_51_12]|nr:MAG: Thioredoxin reductase [Parcubacteria group bacterium GW2011_GWA2_51_12]
MISNGVNSRKVIIIGSGPAGLTAAIYAARAELQPLLLAGAAFGGQLMLTTEVGNYPGFVEDIKGPELMQRMLAQAKRFGADVELTDVTRVDFSKRPFRVCATCDGFFFKGKKVVVVGGGDVAMEDSNFLTKFASEVIIIHRRGTLRASKILQKRAFDNPKIKFIWNSAVEEVLGKDKVEGVRIKNLKTGAAEELAAEGLFVAIGHEPNTKFLQGSGVELDEKAYIKKQKRSLTNIEGVFVAGDVEDHLYRQAVTAAGDGCRAAMDAEKWLAEQESKT